VNPLHTRKHDARALSVASAALVIASIGVGSAAFAAPTPSPTTSSKPVACAPEDGVTASSVTVDLIMPKTGTAAPTYVGFDAAARLRIDQENAKGGVFGRKIKLNAVLDDQGSGAVQTGTAVKAIENDRVFGILATSPVETMYPYFKQKNIPVVGQRGALAYGTDRNAFGSNGAWSNRYSTTMWTTRLKVAGATRASAIGPGTGSGIVAANNVYGQYPIFGMAQAVKITDLSLGAFDGTSTALRLKQANADGVFSLLSTDGNISVYQAMKQQGFTPKGFIATGITDPAVVAKVGSAIEGMISGTYGAVPYNVPVPAMRTFIGAMKAAGLNPYTSVAPMGYISADLFIRGLKEAGKCLTRESFISKLRQVDNFTGSGLLPQKVSYRPGLTPNGNPPKCMWFSTVINGALVPDAKPTCGEKFYDMETNTLVAG